MDAWEILAAETLAYPAEWRERLRAAPQLSGRELWRLHVEYGRWTGRQVRSFLQRHPTLQPTLAGSHGHTVFHAPAAGFTTQIGDGAALAAALGLPVVTELRASDVAAGGQGAPLAPLADQLLFPQYDAFLNLGGIANLSYRHPDGRWRAGDISGCCQILDRLAARAGLPYDAGGKLAASGTSHPAVAARLAALPFHAQPYPRSLSNQWVRETLWPIMAEAELTTADALQTFSAWLADQIITDLQRVAEHLLTNRPEQTGTQRAASAGAGERTKCAVLITGGGAHNDYLVERLRAASVRHDAAFTFVVPASRICDFKEATLIALCAMLRLRGLPNALAAATGASRDTCNGAIYLPG